ncbi:unnamed protein product [Cuscuta campestris]|uniref:WPP domain-containing protein n=1 Tax=Cuscuta campestris TaxID=132261 RepID=A0A484KCQ5_9ASTE|nr:unnamed protein product [Cuscuta campestris]
MADKVEEQPHAGAATNASTMSETEAPQGAQENPAPESPKKPDTFSFSIWPPNEKTRDAVVKRLIETLSAPSILSKRYGTIPDEEASEIAKRIEEEAFNVAGGSAGVRDGDDGIETLQVYSKEVSKRMLDTVKSRSTTPLPPQESKPSEESGGPLEAPPPATGEEIPAAET